MAGKVGHKMKGKRGSPNPTDVVDHLTGKVRLILAHDWK